MHVPRLCASLLLTAATLLAAVPWAPVVLAQSLDERVVDEAGVLTEADRQEAEAAIASLEDAENVQLWALFVRTTDGQPIGDAADAIAADSGLGGNDALLLVAIDDRRDALWVGDLLDVVEDIEIDTIIANDVEPRLADGEWGAAVAGAANGLREAMSGDVAPEPGGQPAPNGDAAGPGLGTILLLVLVAAGAWWVWTRWRAGRAVAAEDQERDRRLRRLAQRANAVLIETDELLRQNAQELGFVEAEFGAEAVQPFRSALDAARAELQEAFRLRQALDDRQPDEPPERERLLNEIVARCTKARQLVDEQTERFRQLRDLERRAPEVLAEVARGVGTVRARIPGVQAQLAMLRAEAAGSSRAVHGHVAEAEKRLALAERGVADGRAALERGDRGAAGRAAKASQDALGQAGTLLDAVVREAEALDEARTELDPAVARARADVEAAKQAVEAAAQTDQADELAAAAARLDEADEALRAQPRDIVLAYRLAREAEAAADQVVARVREGEARVAKERAAVDAEIRAAELSLDRTADFIAARRHGVGRRPRTALSEADAALERARALRDSDPSGALIEAQRAGDLADEAYARAQQQFAGADDAGYGGTVIINGQPFRVGRRSQWGADVGGAVLGGIIGSILSGGGRGGWGGGGFGGGGFGGGGFGGGGFGGGGGRSRGGGW